MKGKKPEFRPRETLLGDHCREAQQSRLEFGLISAVDSEGQTIWIVDAHRDDGKRFVVRSDEKLTAFLELERITHELAVSALLGDDNN